MGDTAQGYLDPMESPIDVLTRTVYGLLSSGALGVGPGDEPRPASHHEGALRRAARILRLRLH
jgi:hypothetical protein